MLVFGLQLSVLFVIDRFDFIRRFVDAFQLVYLCLSWYWIELTILARIEHKRVHVRRSLIDRVTIEPIHRLCLCVKLWYFSFDLLIGFLINSLFHLLIFLLLVQFLEAVPTHSHSLVISEIRHFDEIFWTLGADNCATLSAVMTSFEKAKLNLTKEARLCLVSCPIRPLGNLEILYPSLIRLWSHESFVVWYSWKTDGAALSLIDCCRYTQN